MRWLTLCRFSAKRNNWGWADGVLASDALFRRDSLTLTAKVDCIELFDADGDALA